VYSTSARFVRIHAAIYVTGSRQTPGFVFLASPSSFGKGDDLLMIAVGGAIGNLFTDNERPSRIGDVYAGYTR